MARRARSGRTRIGKVSLYRHRHSFWIYYRENGQPQRRRLGQDSVDAYAVAAQINADLAKQQPTMLSFRPATVEELRRRWLEQHEHVLRSSLATVSRYTTATQHLLTYCESGANPRHAHELQVEGFVRWLRLREVAPNGHPHAARRTLRDKGIQFVLGACRSMYSYAQKHGMLPPYANNPFTALRVEQLPVEDAKPIHVFSTEEEGGFLSACDRWQFPIFYALAKLGLRSGELTHLLVEDVDLALGMLHIRNKPELGWQIKTRNARSIPLPADILAVLRYVIGDRKGGVLFFRQRFLAPGEPPPAMSTRRLMVEALSSRADGAKVAGGTIGRVEVARIARRVWHDAGFLDSDDIRNAFMEITRRIGLPDVTCPKCWRHTFATLLQEAGVDPLIRQQTMGHVPAGAGRQLLGMTATYTHTQLEVHRQQLQRAMDLRPKTIALVQEFLANCQGGRG